MVSENWEMTYMQMYAYRTYALSNVCNKMLELLESSDIA